jgi:uncharacterized membrane protein YagU involved in acid resistance
VCGHAPDVGKENVTVQLGVFLVCMCVHVFVSSLCSCSRLWQRECYGAILIYTVSFAHGVLFPALS